MSTTRGSSLRKCWRPCRVGPRERCSGWSCCQTCSRWTWPWLGSRRDPNQAGPWRIQHLSSLCKICQSIKRGFFYTFYFPSMTQKFVKLYWTEEAPTCLWFKFVLVRERDTRDFFYIRKAAQKLKLMQKNSTSTASIWEKLKKPSTSTIVVQKWTFLVRWHFDYQANIFLQILPKIFDE